MKLLAQMNELVRTARVHLPAAQADGDPHLTLCHMLADQFDLWDPVPEAEGGGARFPIWLCHIVQGVMNDPDGPL